MNSSTQENLGEKAEKGRAEQAKVPNKTIATYQLANTTSLHPSRTIHRTFKIAAADSPKTVSLQSKSNFQTFILQFPVSVLATQPGQISNLTFELVPLTRQWQVKQISPDTTLASDLLGPIAVEQKANQNTDMNLRAATSYPQVGSLNLNFQSRDAQQTVRRQQLKPKASPIITSGTLARGSGAFVRLRPAADFLVEGNHLIELVFVAPNNWRSELIRLRCHAKIGKKEFQKLFTIPVHQSQDVQAKQLARKFSSVDRTTLNDLNAWSTDQKSTKLKIGQGIFNFSAAQNNEQLGKRSLNFLFSGKSQPPKKLFSALPKSQKQNLSNWISTRQQFLSLNAKE